MPTNDLTEPQPATPRTTHHQVGPSPTPPDPGISNRPREHVARIGWIRQRFAPDPVAHVIRRILSDLALASAARFRCSPQLPGKASSWQVGSIDWLRGTSISQKRFPPLSRNYHPPQWRTPAPESGHSQGSRASSAAIARLGCDQALGQHSFHPVHFGIAKFSTLFPRTSLRNYSSVTCWPKPLAHSRNRPRTLHPPLSGE